MRPFISKKCSWRSFLVADGGALGEASILTPVAQSYLKMLVLEGRDSGGSLNTPKSVFFFFFNFSALIFGEERA